MKKTLILVCVLMSMLTVVAQDQQPRRGPGNVFLLMDANKDGSVSKEEMLAWFDKVDSNKDGVLSQEELRAVRPTGNPPAFRGPRGPRT